MDLQLQGKRALITGSTLGIGRAIAKALIQEGAEVIVTSRDKSRVEATVAELAQHGKVSGIEADCATAEGISQLIEFANNAGNIDILVNNVGYFEVKPFDEIQDADWQKTFDLNIMSGVRLSRAFMNKMMQNNWGRIIFIASDQSSKPNPVMIHYAMSKTAQISIARGLAELTKGSAVTVNSVQVAPTWTDGVKKFMNQMAEKESTTPEEMTKAYFAEGEGRSSLLQRWADPEEIADYVTFLCSPKASAINGSASRADGGMIRSLF